MTQTTSPVITSTINLGAQIVITRGFAKWNIGTVTAIGERRSDFRLVQVELPGYGLRWLPDDIMEPYAE